MKTGRTRGTRRLFYALSVTAAMAAPTKRVHLSRKGQRLFALSTLAAALLAACGGGGGGGGANGDSQALSVDSPKQILALGMPGDPIDAGVTGMTLVSETRVDRTTYDYVYKLTVKNGTQPQTATVATLTGTGQGTTIVDGSSSVGSLAAGATATPSDTITVRHDRTQPFNTAALTFKVVGNMTNAPSAIKMVWFGITNWHYQIGDVGILLDGETRNAALQLASVTKALDSLKREGTIDAILVGHDHGDHSNQVPGWAAQTGKPVYASGGVCTKLRNLGLPDSQCTTLLGGETIKLGDFVTVRAVRWVHSNDCGEFSNGTGGIETFGYLLTARSNEMDKVLNLYVSDSGAGGLDLTTPRRVGTTAYGSPIENLRAAMLAAGLNKLAIWQGGPESRMVNQAKLVVPTFHVETFMPHHLNARGNDQANFNLLYGMHYAYGINDQPMLNSFLQSQGVPQVFPTNYFDAWTYGTNGIVKIPNTAMKADYGLPPEGPGPGVQGPNPRLGDLECSGDGDPFVPMPAPL